MFLVILLFTLVAITLAAMPHGGELSRGGMELDESVEGIQLKIIYLILSSTIHYLIASAICNYPTFIICTHRCG